MTIGIKKGFSGLAILAAAGAAALALAGCAPRESGAGAAGDAATAATASVNLPVLGASPAWKAVALDGRPLGRDELKGKVVVVDFWASYCVPCLHEIPGFVRLQEKYRERGVVFVGLSADRNMEMMQRYIAQAAMNYPVAMLDEAVLEAFGERELIMPTTYLIDREGRVRHRKVGPAEERDYEQLIRSLL